MGMIFAIPVSIVEGLIVTRWWNSAGQQDYIPWGPSRAMTIGWSIGGAFFMAFLVYGWFENTLKYMIIRAHLHHPIFYHAAGLPLLGLAVGLGFATTENIGFMLLYGFVASVCRGPLNVFFMGVMGLIIGTILARHEWHRGGNVDYNNPAAAQAAQAPRNDARYGARHNDGFGLYLKAIILPFILTGLFHLPYMVIFNRHRLYTYWSLWFLASLGVLIISFIVYFTMSRSLKGLDVVPMTSPEAHNVYAREGNREGVRA